MANCLVLSFNSVLQFFDLLYFISEITVVKPTSLDNILTRLEFMGTGRSAAPFQDHSI